MAAKEAAKIAVEIGNEMAIARTATAVECCIIAGMITCVDEFNFGTDESKLHGRRSKVRRFSDGVLDTLEHAAGRYDDAMLAGLCYQARQRGIDVSEIDIANAYRSAEDIEREIIEKLNSEHGISE